MEVELEAGLNADPTIQFVIQGEKKGTGHEWVRQIIFETPDLTPVLTGANRNRLTSNRNRQTPNRNQRGRWLAGKSNPACGSVVGLLGWVLVGLLGWLPVAGHGIWAHVLTAGQNVCPYTVNRHCDGTLGSRCSAHIPPWSERKIVTWNYMPVGQSGAQAGAQAPVKQLERAA